MRTTSFLLKAGFAVFVSIPFYVHAEGPVIVHEWGTFTALQDDRGQAIKGINVDDEPVPPFVYEVGKVRVTPQYSSGQKNFGLPPYPRYESESWTPGDPQVTLRLETPVVYFYPPKREAAQSIPPLKVQVDFHGGILSQFYPYALERVMGTHGETINQSVISEQTNSRLVWKDVRLGSARSPIETADKVWTTPREVGASVLQVDNPYPEAAGVTSSAQAEHFLFYRGVGHLDAPLRLQDGNGEVGVWPQTSFDGGAYAHAWLTEIHADGSCAFHDLNSLEPQEALRPEPLATVSEKFAPSDFSADNLATLKASMQAALVKEGLYPDEASAMLRTWELSYFKNPGLRFFYIVPRAWVDKVLPLKITGAPTKVTRVMIGRIELITNTQRAALDRLAQGPCPDLPALKKAALAALSDSKLPKDEVDAFYHGEKPLSELGIAIPPLVQDYLSLGRFRDALIVHEQQLHPSPALSEFIKVNQLAVQN